MQDFCDVDLMAIDDFEEYVRRAGEIIDRRSRRFTALQPGVADEG